MFNIAYVKNRKTYDLLTMNGFEDVHGDGGEEFTKALF
jgi:hypothetical protein